MIIETFKRYEKKYYLTLKQFDGLLKVVAPHMSFDPYCTGGRYYPLYNLYFDTPDHRILLDSLSKPIYKEKLRLRSYVPDPSDNNKVFIEIKKKFDGIVNKRRATLLYLDAIRYLKYGEIDLPDTPETYVKRRVLTEIDYFMQIHDYKVQPAIYVAYDRIAMFGKSDHEFRMTFDNNIRARIETEYSLNAEKPCEQLLPPDVFLMELKIASALPMWLTEALSGFRIFPTTFSKVGKAYEMFRTGIPAYQGVTKALQHACAL